MSAPERPPVAAQYVVTFLKPEMLHIHRQITALRAWRPVVLCQKRENADRFPWDDLVVIRKPLSHPLRRIWQKQILGHSITIYRSEARQIARELRRIEARVLHVYFGHIAVHLRPLLEISELPVVVSFHGADAGVDLEKAAHRDAMRDVFARAALLLVRSESLAEQLVAHGAPRQKIRLHRTGLALGEIAFSQREMPEDGAWRCVQAGRLIEKKGIATTLAAFAEFARGCPRATLTIAGEGPLREALWQRAAELGIAGRVFFAGFLDQEKLRALYAQAHLFLHPSEMGPDGNQEGVPNAMLEAMASGLPVLATRHGGIPEAVEHGVSGLLVPEKDSRALAGALMELSTNPERYRAMSEIGRAHV